jgi:hypothetical protein
MRVNEDVLKANLGDKYNPDATYEIVKHRDAYRHELKGNKVVGEIPDGSQSEKGTMAVVELKPEEPNDR